MTDAAPRLEVVYRDPKTLAPYDNNPRRTPEKAVEACRRSIRALGFRNPIILDVAGGLVVVAGHTRLKAALLEELPEVPTIDTAGLTPDQIKAYRIADNRIADLSQDDPDLLAAELRSMEEAALREHGLAEAMALDDEYVDRVLREDAVGDEGGEKADEPVEPTTGPTITKPGDLITLGRHRLLCGDATKAEDVATLLNGATPRLMVTDPPYGVGYDDPGWRKPRGGDVSTGPPGDEGTYPLPRAVRHFGGDVAYVWSTPSKIAAPIRALVAEGFEDRAVLVWRKDEPIISRGHYHHQAELCAYAVRRAAHWIGDRKQSTVWDIARRSRRDTGHSTQKPMECMERPIRNHEGDVYDPFVGSGTTILAAERQRRTCYAMELSPAFCDMIARRWKTVTGQDAVRP